MELSSQVSGDAVGYYICLFANASKTGQHEVILECLDYHGLMSTSELTLEQAIEFWIQKEGDSMAGKYDPFGNCKSCGERVLWIKTRAGKNMPVNPQLVNYKAVPGGRERIVTPEGTVIAGEKVGPDEADGYGYISHFATCARR